MAGRSLRSAGRLLIKLLTESLGVCLALARPLDAGIGRTGRGLVAPTMHCWPLCFTIGSSPADCYPTICATVGAAHGELVALPTRGVI